MEELLALALIATVLLFRKRWEFRTVVETWSSAHDCEIRNVAHYSENLNHSTLSEDAFVSALWDSPMISGSNRTLILHHAALRAKS